MHHTVYRPSDPKTKQSSVEKFHWWVWPFNICTPVLFHNLEIKHLVNNVSNTSSHFHPWQCVLHDQKKQMLFLPTNSEGVDVMSCTALQMFSTASVNQSGAIVTRISEKKKWSYCTVKLFLHSYTTINSCPHPPFLLSITCWMCCLLHKDSQAYSAWK